METMNDTTTERPPYGLAALATAAVLAIYVFTIAPTTQFWDTSVYIASAKVLGIPHPPGNPLFVTLPGGGSVRVCTRYMLLPDGKELMGVGIQPELPVELRIADMASGKDPVPSADSARIPAQRTCRRAISPAPGLASPPFRLLATSLGPQKK